MIAHDISAAEAALKLETDIINGLSDLEVASRLAKYGENKLKGKKKKT